MSEQAIKHIVCYSGGHSSALVAINVFLKYGKGNLVLLNHNISSSVEDEDIKRFKKQVAEYIGVDITYANYKDMDDPSDQFDVTIEAKAFKVGSGSELCTSRLKTEPFMRWLHKNCDKDKTTIYYGFDKKETTRIQRRSSILGGMGWKTDYPLALWENLIVQSTKDIGIEPPLTYSHFKHANCIGCLKAGRQHWYIVYCTRPDVWEKAKMAEEIIGYSIDREFFLEELEEKFQTMREKQIPITEHIPFQTFWAAVRKVLKDVDIGEDTVVKPCECVI